MDDTPYQKEEQITNKTDMVFTGCLYQIEDDKSRPADTPLSETQTHGVVHRQAQTTDAPAVTEGESYSKGSSSFVHAGGGSHGGWSTRIHRVLLTEVCPILLVLVVTRSDITSLNVMSPRSGWPGD